MGFPTVRERDFGNMLSQNNWRLWEKWIFSHLKLFLKLKVTGILRRFSTDQTRKRPSFGWTFFVFSLSLSNCEPVSHPLLKLRSGNGFSPSFRYTCLKNSSQGKWTVSLKKKPVVCIGGSYPPTLTKKTLQKESFLWAQPPVGGTPLQVNFQNLRQAEKAWFHLL